MKKLHVICYKPKGPQFHYRLIKIAGLHNILCYNMWSRRTGLKMKAGETMSVVVEHEPTYYKRSMVAYRAGDFIDIFGDEKGRRGSYCLLSVPYTKWLKLTGLRITDGKFLGFMIKRVEEVDDYS